MLLAAAQQQRTEGRSLERPREASSLPDRRMRIGGVQGALAPVRGPKSVFTPGAPLGNSASEPGRRGARGFGPPCKCPPLFFTKSEEHFGLDCSIWPSPDRLSLSPLTERERATPLRDGEVWADRVPEGVHGEHQHSLPDLRDCPPGLRLVRACRRLRGDRRDDHQGAGHWADCRRTFLDAALHRESRAAPAASDTPALIPACSQPARPVATARISKRSAR